MLVVFLRYHCGSEVPCSREDLSDIYSCCVSLLLNGSENRVIGRVIGQMVLRSPFGKALKNSWRAIKLGQRESLPR